MKTDNRVRNVDNSLFTKEVDRFNMNFSAATFSRIKPGYAINVLRPVFTRVYGIMSGHGTIHCNGRDIPMEPGNLYILPTELDFSYLINTNMEKVYYHITLPRYDKYDLFRYIKDCIVFPHREKEIQQAFRWLKQADAYSAAQTKVWLYQVAMEGFRACGVNFGSIEEYSPLVKQAIRYVEEHYRSGLTADVIADALFVSKSRLQKAFRQEVGMSLGRYANDQLFYKADQLLRLTNRPIKDISAELGFCDPFYFSRVFSQRVGISPSRYRNLHNT